MGMEEEYLLDKKLTLDDGKTYLVIEQVNLDNHTYLYIANNEDNTDTKFIEIKDDDIFTIEPKLFAEKVLPLFLEKLNK